MQPLNHQADHTPVLLTIYTVPAAFHRSHLFSSYARKVLAFQSLQKLHTTLKMSVPH